MYRGGGNFITEAWPTNFHSFSERKLLPPTASLADWREVTAAERAAIEAADAKWSRPEQWLIDWWNEACRVYQEGDGVIVDGKYNEATGYFEHRNLKDITASQALAILNFGVPWHYYGTHTDLGYGLTCRSALRPNLKYNKSCAFTTCFHGSDLEQLYIPNVDIGGNMYMTKVKWLTCMNVKDATVTSAMPELVEFRYAIPYGGKANRCNKSFAMSSKLSLASVKNIIANESDSGSSIWIAFHATVYAKLMGDTTKPEVAAMSDEELAEWTALPAQAAAKGITLGT